MFLGIDLGTSSLKVVLVDGLQRVVDEASAPLSLSHPRPRWSEQAPSAWEQAATAALDLLATRQDLSAVQGIGLSGQMHGATLLDAADRVLRPAILWNDGRADKECRELERLVPELETLTGNRAMPGFTAPKLLWVRRHEPSVFSQVKTVLLPKDYLRLFLTGEHATDASDAAGTLWLDMRTRRWSPTLLAACALSEGHMPVVLEGTSSTGGLRQALAERWGLRAGTPVAAGAGDNAAVGAGLGVTAAGQAFVSLGTSGVYFAATEGYVSNPKRGVHAFCHCLPATWHVMSVALSAGGSLAWLASLLRAPEAELLAEAEAEEPRASSALFLPYLSGERTPHDDPHAKGVLFGLTSATTRASITQAVLEGVAFAMADGQDALLEAGSRIDSVWMAGGGARSTYWARILATALGRPLLRGRGAELGAAFGAARLARLAVTGEAPAAVCSPPPLEEVVEPVAAWRDASAERRAEFMALYPALKGRFRAPSTPSERERAES